MYIFILIGGIVLLLIIYIFITWNSFISLNNGIDEAFSAMDVYLKKRWDLIPNLVETVKGYAKHESETLEKVTALRNKSYDHLSNEDKLQTNNEVNNDIRELFALAESYPDLKVSENFLSLSKSLSEIESEIAKSRKYYNAVIRIYNNKVEKFPSNLIAKVYGFKTKEMFGITDNERQNVDVELWEK